jgi:hypothetical protein
MKKRFILLLTITVIATLMTGHALALSASEIKLPDLPLTMSVSMEQQQLEECITAIQRNENMNDSDKITSLTKAWFESRIENYLADDYDLDLSVFMKIADNSYHVNKTQNEIIWQKYMRQTADRLYRNGESDMVENETKFTVHDMRVSDYDAEIVFDGVHTWRYIDSDIRSSSGHSYTMRFEKTDDDKWLITEVDFYDEMYPANIDDPDLDVKGTIDSARAEEQKYIAEMAARSAGQEEPELVQPDIDIQMLPGATTQRAMNTTLAASYATNHGGTGTYNSAFTSFPSDCQNFVSQCVWAGLGGTNSGIPTHAVPMATNSGREWYNSAIANDYTNSWISLSKFTTYIQNGSQSTYGLAGAIFSSIAGVNQGDIIHIYKDEEGGWFHTYFVNSVTGTAGSRTAANIYVSGHTTNYSSVQLSSVWSVTSSNTRSARVYYVIY